MFSSKGAIAFKKKGRKRRKIKFQGSNWRKHIAAGKYFSWGYKSSLLEKDKSIKREIRGGPCVYFTSKLKHTSAMNAQENSAFNYITVNM